MNCSAARPPPLQIARDAVEIGAPPALADRLDHLDRRDGVEQFGGVAVILQAGFRSGPKVPPRRSGCSAQAFCSVDKVRPTAETPRLAASMASVPQPQPMSSRRWPGFSVEPVEQHAEFCAAGRPPDYRPVKRSAPTE